MRLLMLVLSLLAFAGAAPAQMSGTGGGTMPSNPLFGDDQSECGYFVLDGRLPFVRIELDVYGAANTIYDAYVYAAADQEPYGVWDWGACVANDREFDCGGVTLDAQGRGKLIINIPIEALPAADYGWAWKAELRDTLGGATLYDTAFGYVSIPE